MVYATAGGSRIPGKRLEARKGDKEFDMRNDKRKYPIADIAVLLQVVGGIFLGLLWLIIAGYAAAITDSGAMFFIVLVCGGGLSFFLLDRLVTAMGGNNPENSWWRRSK